MQSFWSCFVHYLYPLIPGDRIIFLKCMPCELVEWRTVKDFNKLSVDLLILLRAMLTVLKRREIELVLLDERAPLV